MADSGRTVVVLTGEGAPLPTDGYAVLTTPLLNLESIKTGRQKNLLGRFGKLLAEVVHRHGVGIVHGHNLHHFHAAPALAIEALRQKTGIRVFHSFHETWPDLLHENPVYQAWNGNYAVSRHVQAECETRLGFSPSLFRLGVDTSRFRTDGDCLSSSGPPVILHPARLLPWKGVDVGIRSLGILRDRGLVAHLLITDTQRIADWDNELVAYRRVIAGLIADLGLADQVRFVEASYADMPALYERADIVIYPTIGEEPYGLVPVEAMSCGRPVIASNSGGIPETIVDGMTGYIVPRGDPDKLADRLAELITNPDLAKRLGRAGRRHARKNFDQGYYLSKVLRDFDSA